MLKTVCWGCYEQLIKNKKIPFLLCAGLTGKILNSISAAGFQISALRMVNLKLAPFYSTLVWLGHILIALKNCIPSAPFCSINFTCLFHRRRLCGRRDLNTERWPLAVHLRYCIRSDVHSQWSRVDPARLFISADICGARRAINANELSARPRPVHPWCSLAAKITNSPYLVHHN